MHTIWSVNAVFSWIFFIGDGNAESVNISAHTGDTVHLPCTSRTTPSSWQHQTEPSSTLYYVWVEGAIMPKYGERFALPLAPSGDYTLVISHVNNTDYGEYQCVEAEGTDGADKHLVRLTVVDVTPKSLVTSTQQAVIIVNGVSRWIVAILVVCSSMVTAVASVVIMWLVLRCRRRNVSMLAATPRETMRLARRTDNTDVGKAEPLDISMNDSTNNTAVSLHAHLSAVAASVTVEHLDIDMNDSTRIIYKLSLSGRVFGTTSIDNWLFVLHQAETDQIIGFNRTQYTVEWTGSIPGLTFFCNCIASCTKNACLFVSDSTNKCIHKINLQPSKEIAKWPVNFHSRGISVTASGFLLVAYQNSQTLQKLSEDGECLCEIAIVGSNPSPFHAVELSNKQIVVSHGYCNNVADSDYKDDSDNIVIIDTNGKL